MKKIIGWMIIGTFLAVAAQSKAQTNTNIDITDTNVVATGPTNWDFSALPLQLSLKVFTNMDGANGNIESSGMRLATKDVIQLLSGRISFPLEKIFDGEGTPIPHRMAAVMTNYSSTAKLLVLQSLGTNHGKDFIVVQDGKPPVNYDVSDYFTFMKRGFDTTGTNQVVRGSNAKKDPLTTGIFIADVTFDNMVYGGGGDRVAFDASGYTKEQRGAATVKKTVVDPDSTRTLESNLAGSGAITTNFTIVTGTVTAKSPTVESQ